MTPESQRRLSIKLGVLAGILFALLVWLFGHNALLTVRLAKADGDTAIYEQMMRDALSTTDSASAAKFLNYMWNFYPSGSVQEVGSRLDRIVERGRMSSALVIIAHLRVITGKDLGDKPEPWIEKFAEK